MEVIRLGSGSNVGGTERKCLGNDFFFARCFVTSDDKSDFN